MKEILHYFVNNPQTACSLEGVMRWRLLREPIRNSVEETREALGWLAAQGYLLQEFSPLSGPVFRLNVAKREKIKVLLAKGRKPRRTPQGNPKSNTE